MPCPYPSHGLASCCLNERSPLVPASRDEQQDLQDALKQATAALKQHGPPFALAGSYALWVHGAAEPAHDVDLTVAEQDADAAAETLRVAGFEVVRTPEDWLFKAHLGSAMVDVLHRFNGVPVDADLVAGATEFEVLGVRIPVLPAMDVVRTKLLSLTEHYCDFAALLPPVRAVREQLDWRRLHELTDGNDFAAAFLFLADRLGLTGEVSPSD
jgi:hypothetical protein